MESESLGIKVPPYHFAYSPYHYDYSSVHYSSYPADFKPRPYFPLSEPPQDLAFKPPPYFSLSEPICRLPDPAQPDKLCLRRQGSHGPLSMCFSCKGKHLKGSKHYYYCATCNLEFHRGCHVLLPEIRHPFHPSHPLTLFYLDRRFKMSEISQDRWTDYEYNGNGNGNGNDEDDNDVVSSDDDGGVSLTDGTYYKCKCCGDRLGKLYYHCSICNFNLNKKCAMRPPPPTTISHSKSHEHTLTLFPIRLPLPCDVCGLSLNDTEDFVYTCLSCSHMVHRSCIYLPRVIKITRHPHRLSITSSLRPGDLSCGICRQTVDVNYGQYSCDKGCHYAVHSKCATRQDVWDGKDLDGMPEEPDEYIEPPFLKIDEETIQHFSHEHYLRLGEKKTICEKEKFCDACTFPIMISHKLYGCMQCDFVLDEACASLPRKSYNPLHKHPLTLHPSPIGEMRQFYLGESIFRCDGCHRFSCGFLYKCSEKYCEFRLDTRCASLPDPLNHDCHPHDLFFKLTKGDCMRCGSLKCSSYFLECNSNTCKSFLGITCATLPSKAHYKHDRHPLTLSYGEKEDTTSGQYWCEKCESKLDPRKWFYTCNPCAITLHVNCLMGEDIYMKPQHILKTDNDDTKVEIARNEGNSRLFCYECHRRCAQTLVFKIKTMGGYKSYCTLNCIYDGRKPDKLSENPNACCIC